MSLRTSIYRSVAISEFNWDCFVAKAPRNDENVRYEITIRNFSSAYYWLGRIYYERGNYQEAANNWKEVLRLEPENKKAEYWLRETEKQLK